MTPEILWVATTLQKQVFAALDRAGGKATVRELVKRELLPDRPTLIGYGVALSGLADLGVVEGFRPANYNGEGTTWQIVRTGSRHDGASAASTHPPTVYRTG